MVQVFQKIVPFFLEPVKGVKGKITLSLSIFWLHEPIYKDQSRLVLALSKQHPTTGLPPVAELIPEVKASLVIVMRKCPIDCQTFDVIGFVKSFAMNKSEKRP